jgi:cytochrome c peroxidase
MKCTRYVRSSFLLQIALAALIISFSFAGRGAQPTLPPEYPAMNIPEDNPLTEEKIALGERLFFEKGLSADHSVSCGSCHNPSRFFADVVAISKGVHDYQGQRNAISLLNTAYSPHLMWDGRSVSLEDQVGYPLMHPREMASTRAAAVQFVTAEPSYQSAFKQAFGRDKITWDQLAKAIASFERTLVSGDAPFDRYMSGDASAISAAAKRGFDFFSGQGGCTGCHTYDKKNPFFTDFQFHNTGVAWQTSADLGRYEISKEREDKGAFRTPSLRNVAQTAPYMHNGEFKTLSEVLNFYSQGCGKNPFLDARLHALNFTSQQKQDLLAFFDTLTGDNRYKPRATVKNIHNISETGGEAGPYEFGHVEVVAGNSDFGDNGPAMEALFVGIGGIAADPAGNVYVSDTGGNRVRKIDHKSGVISTVAGTGLLYGSDSSQAISQPLRGPGPLAISADGTTLYIGEIIGRKVQRLILSTGAMNDLGTPQGGFGKPDGLAWAPSGLLVADPPRGQVWKLLPDGTWAPTWNKEARPKGANRTVAVDALGRIYAAEYFAHRVLRWDAESESMKVVAGTGEEGRAADGANGPDSPLHTPDGLVVDASGDLLIADKGNHRIVRVNHVSGRLTTVVESGSPGTAERWTPGPIAVDAKGQIWIGDIYQSRVLRYRAGDTKPVVIAGKGSIGDGGPALRARFAHPGAVASDQQGNIYVSDTLHHRVRVINAKSGLIQTVAGAGVPGYNGDGLPARAAWLAYPGKLQLDHKGHLYIGDYYNNRVRQVDLQSGLISTLAGNGTAGEFGDDGQASDAALINPHALWLQSEQALVIASAVSSKLRWVDLENGRIHSVPIHTEIPSTLVFYGVASWNGGLVLASPRPGSIQTIKKGEVSTLLDRSQIVFPQDVAVSPDGQLYICETGRNRIVRWNGQGLDVIAENLGRPRSINFDASGNLLVADTFHNRILRITITKPLPAQSRRRQPSSHRRPSSGGPA